MKRIWCWVICCMLLLGCLPFANAESAVIEVATKAQFDAIRENLSASYRLTADIEFTAEDFEKGGAYYNDGAGFLPFGNSETYFRGTLDGNGHTVSGLVMNGSGSSSATATSFALVARNSGTIRDLRLQNMTVSYIAEVDSGMALDQHDVGILVGFNSGLGVIERCAVAGSITATHKEKMMYVGSIAGENQGTIQNCYANTDMKLIYDVETDGGTPTAAMGGICGANMATPSTTGSLSGCYADVRQTLNAPTDRSDIFVGPVTAWVSSKHNYNCYYLDNGVTPVIKEVVVNGLTTCYAVTDETAKVQNTFTALDFTQVWKMNNFSPVLAVFPCLHQTGGYIRDADGHYKTCTLCSGRVDAGAHIPATLPYEGQAAGCLKDGLGYTACSACSYIIESNVVIPAVGEHKYDDACDTICNVCKETRTISHSYGNYIYNNDATYEKDGTKSRTCSVCGNKETVTAEGTKLTKPPVITNPFVDVKEGKFYYDAVLWAASENITSGTTATTFSPDNACTRGQIVTFLWRAAGSPKASTTQTPFTDIKKGSFYYDAVLWAVENGITTGTSATTFSPNSTCTRGQIVTFLWRFWGEKEAAVANPFTDTTGGAYYTKAMLWAVESGITTGTSATTFSPNNACTRGQCVTFLYRSFGN